MNLTLDQKEESPLYLTSHNNEAGAKLGETYEDKIYLEISDFDVWFPGGRG